MTRAIEPAAANGPGEAAVRPVVAAVIVVGAALRVVYYLVGRSFWIDEARLALNIAERSYRALLQPLAYDQTAPVLFLWAERLAFALGGANELALRALPLLAGIACVLITYPLARRVLSAPAAVLATAVTAFSPTLVHYSSELKPYSSDALVAMVLALVAFDWLAEPGSRRRLVILASVGLVAPWVSAPAIFVLAAIGVTAVWVAARRQPSTLPAAIALLGAWVTSFGLAYLLSYRSVSQAPYMRRFWEHAFLRPGAPDLVTRAWALWREVLWGAFLGGPSAGNVSGASGLQALNANLAAVVFTGLLVHGLRRLKLTVDAPGMAVLIAPGLALLAAAVARVYPIGLRIALFEAPLLAIILAAGLEPVVRAIPLRTPARRWLALGAIWVLPAFRTTLAEIADLKDYEPMRRLVHEYQRQRRPGEPVYVLAGAVPAWAFYTTDWHAPDRARLAEMARLASWRGASFENASRAEAMQSIGVAAPTLGNGAELLGLASGVEWRQGVGMIDSVAAPGWVAAEQGRLRAAARPTIWVVMTHFAPSELMLLRGLRVLGGRFAYLHQEQSGILARLEFQ